MCNNCQDDRCIDCSERRFDDYYVVGEMMINLEWGSVEEISRILPRPYAVCKSCDICECGCAKWFHLFNEEKHACVTKGCGCKEWRFKRHCYERRGDMMAKRLNELTTVQLAVLSRRVEEEWLRRERYNPRNREWMEEDNE